MMLFMGEILHCLQYLCLKNFSRLGLSGGARFPPLAHTHTVSVWGRWEAFVA